MSVPNNMVLLGFPPRVVAQLIPVIISCIPILVGVFSMWMQFADLAFYGIPLFGKAKIADSYDFIVVGAGSAGSAVAGRLSEDPRVSVLLLESGGDPNPLTYIPAAAPYLAHPSTYYFYSTVPQVNCAFGIINQSLPWPRGRGVGGSSNVNFMIYNRGNPNDYDRWAYITGDQRWSWKNVVRYFLKMEDYYGYWDGNGHHSKGGPLRIEPIRYAPGIDYVLAAGEEIGLPTRDANRIVQTPGLSPIDFTQEKGYRFSTYRAYIKPNEKRSNFKVLRYSQVTRIHFDNNLRAIGVSFLRHGVPKYVGANREIILSAGSMGSAQLLLLSGIGPRDHLLELGIKPLVNLPVGKIQRDLGLGSVLDYIKDGSGPISTPLALGDTLDAAFSTSRNILRRYLEPYVGQDAHFVVQILGLPKSVGNLRLADSDPNSLPLLDPKYYSDAGGQDMNVMLEGIQTVLRLYENTTNLGGKLGARLSPRHIPGCEQHEHRSRNYWECVTRTLTGTLYHPSSTCSMGKPGDPGTVVDSQLRVVGTRGLRVADSSIMPKLVNSNTNAPSIMIGEHCADMVKETWGLRSAAIDRSYDFIVVGGGSAGSAVAARLSEDPSVSVLLLESGGDPNPFSYVPAAVGSFAHELVQFPYVTEPQVNAAFGSINQSILWPRGRGLGGSSNINYMIYNRGNPNDYNRWAEITGDERWSWRTVIQYFLKMEDYYGYWDGNGFHSKGGPVRIEPVNYAPGIDYILAAGEEIGLPTRDPNTIVQTPGISPIDFTTKQGYRFSAYRAYIQPNEHRRNFKILRYSQVVKIHFNDALRAVGVTFVRHNVRHSVGARREIIISAGTMGSPQLLMLSGIGPKKHLQELGIKPLVDLPVGDGLQDHVTTYVGPFLLNKRHTSYIQERDLGISALLNYLRDGTGPISVPQGTTAFGLVSTSSSHHLWSNVFYAITNVGVHQSLGDNLDVVFNTKGNIFRRYLSSHLGQDAHFIIQSLGLPKSVGYLRLADTNPDSLPIINPRYYTDPKGQDMNAMLEGIQVLLNLYENTTSLGEELGAHLSPRHIPGCEQHLHRSRSYWECVVRTLTGTLYHPSSTCAMGKRGDPRTVVDSRLRVLGTKGLRVADSSIMPMVVNTNTNSPAMMIGEQCADIIKDAWGLLDNYDFIVVPWPRGRGLGGSSNVNFMIYNRGHQSDYNRWADITGDQRWNWKNVLRIFLKMEDYYGYWDGNGYHRKGGPLRIEPVRYAPGIDSVLAAGEEVGLPTRDANTIVQTPGISPIDFTQERGFRFSTFRAYIKPNENRPNFRVLRYSQVVKIHFDDKLRAVGVTFLRHGIQQYVGAKKEIILSAGTMGSAQLLMLSGIGPKDHLLELGIKPRLDLPVGNNLQDHVITYVGPFLLNKKHSSYIQERDLGLGAVLDYIKDGSGPLSIPLGSMQFAFLSTSYTNPSWSDLFWSMQNVGVYQSLGDGLDTLFNTRGKIFKRFLKPHVGQDAHFILQILGLPKSVGYLRLPDKNPNSLPIINPRYYTDPEGQDMNVMLEGIQILLNMYENTTSLGRDLGARLSPRHIPGCEQHEHSSNTNAPSIMIGELCADMVKQTWNLFREDIKSSFGFFNYMTILIMFFAVGAGSAGSALAARLSEDTSVSVLLLESGGNPNPFTYIPMAVPYLTHELTEYPYATVPQAHSAFGVKGQSIPWPRGRGLGGTSNTNFMMYNRGNPRDYDRWAHITKDKRWSWKNVLRFYLKMEDYYGYWDGNGFHSKGGPLRIEPVLYAPGSKFVLAAGEEIGLPTRDANRNVQTPGISPIDFTQERGYRFSTYRAYIQPNEKRPNLKILRYSQVVKINFDDELRAKGVTFLRHGVQQYVEAKKEIIISAGTMGSPQLLMLSGIGPKEHLLELGIKPLLDLPVGNNLQDHVVTYVGPFLLKKKHTSFIQERDLGLGAMLNYMKDGSGPISTPMGAMQFGLVSTSFTHPSWSDIFWSMQNVGVHGALGDSLDVLFNTKGHIFKRYLSPHLGQEAHFVIQSLGLPKSVGYLRLPDKNPNSLPIIDPKYYSDPKGQDMNAMLEGIQVLLKLYENTTSLGRELGAHLSPRHIP
ncbi:hypothetical protein Ocin01_07691, partial [Orchesella cincta]